MAVTVNYYNPGSASSLTAPTVAANGLFDTVTARVIATADGDTTATITHNLGLSAADLTAGRPEIYITNLLQVPASTSAWAVTTIAANSITLTKGTGAGSGNAGEQIQVVIKRPHTIGR